jgi:hypothetical protein
LAGLLLSFQKEWWWIFSASGIVISQYLIIKDWHSAKYGTIANVIVLIITIIGFGVWYLSKRLKHTIGNAIWRTRCQRSPHLNSRWNAAWHKKLCLRPILTKLR